MRFWIFAVSALWYTPIASPQTLDEAVIEQLEFSNGKPCGKFLGEEIVWDYFNSLSTFTPLGAICARDNAEAEIDEPAASGGGGVQPPEGIEALSLRGEGWFFSFDAENYNRADAYEFGLLKSRVGGYKILGRGLVGAAVSYHQQSGDYLTVDGEFDSKGYGLTLFSSYVFKEGLRAQVIYENTATYESGWRSTSFEDPYGKVSGTPTNQKKHRQESLELKAYYDFFGSNYTLSPSVTLNKTKLFTSAYTEAGLSGLELHFYDHGFSTDELSLGLRGSSMIDGDLRIRPYFNVEWTQAINPEPTTAYFSFAHDPKQQKIAYQIAEEDPSYYTIETGFEVGVGDAWFFVNYEHLFGKRDVQHNQVSMGLRIAR